MVEESVLSKNSKVFITVRILLGSAILGLFVCLVVSGIASSGVPSMAVTHTLFIVATALAVFAVVTSEVILKMRWWVILSTGVLTLLVIGGGLWILDRWLGYERAQLDILLTPPNPRPPAVTSTAYREPKITAPKVSVSGKNNVVISGSPIQQSSAGANSPNIVGQGNQVTIGSVPPPPRQLTEEQWTLFRKFAGTTPGKVNILAIQGDKEAWEFGQRLGENLREAGWTVIQVTTYISMGGPPQYGLTVHWSGERIIKPNGKILLTTGTSGEALAIGLMQVLEEVYSDPQPGEDAPIYLYVNTNPKAK